MQPPSAEQMMAAARGLPGAALLLERLGNLPGVYLIGGAVRDLLLGYRPLDLDLAVEGDVAPVARALGGEVRSHDRFGTSTVRVGERVYDLARTRREYYGRPGALPEVEPASLVEDLWRRDFTVNTLALPLGGPRAGEVLGVPDALGDLDRRWLRVLHPRSFIDDPTRLVRLARYAGRLRFEVEPQTAALAREAARSGALHTVSGERTGSELRLLAREPGALRALGWLRELDVADAVAPGFASPDALEPGAGALRLLPPDARSDRLVLALALRGVPDAARDALLGRLAFPAPERDGVLTAAARAETVAAALGAARTPSQIAGAAATASPELVALAGALGPRAQAARWLGELRDVKLEIHGGDLLDAGVPAGPAVGRGLRAALVAKLDGRVRDRAGELSEALAAARR